MSKRSVEKSLSDGKHRSLPPKDDSPRMFDRISARYDLLNRLLSLRRDVIWRKRLAKALPPANDMHVIDIATGTGDVLLTAFKQTANFGYGIGVDPAGKMLSLAQLKTSEAHMSDKMSFVRADAVSLPFTSDTFDAATIAFGIRNIVEVETALQEMKRVLRPRGRLVILEFSMPSNPFLKAGYLLYFRHLLPLVGAVVSGDKEAYRYLNRTVETFPYGEEFCKLMRTVGFEDVKTQSLSFGIASLYTGHKPGAQNK